MSSPNHQSKNDTESSDGQGFQLNATSDDPPTKIKAFTPEIDEAIVIDQPTSPKKQSQQITEDLKLS